MTVDRDARDRQAAEARLAERGWVLEHIAPLYVVLRDDPKRHTARNLTRYVVAAGDTWRQAVSEALQEPVF